jgi:hypothetical protein
MDPMLIISLGLLALFAVMANRQAARSAVEVRRVRRLHERRMTIGGGIALTRLR